MDLTLRELLESWRGFAAPMPPTHPSDPPWRVRVVCFSSDAPLALFGIGATDGSAVGRSHYWHIDGGICAPVPAHAHHAGVALQGMLKTRPAPFPIRSVTVTMETRGRRGSAAVRILVVWPTPQSAREIVRGQAPSGTLYELDGRGLQLAVAEWNGMAPGDRPAVDVASIP